VVLGGRIYTSSKTLNPADAIQKAWRARMDPPANGYTGVEA